MFTGRIAEKSPYPKIGSWDSATLSGHVPALPIIINYYLLGLQMGNYNLCNKSSENNSQKEIHTYSISLDLLFCSEEPVGRVAAPGMPKPFA